MFKEYILSKAESKPKSLNPLNPLNQVLEEILDPCVVLRNQGIRIKKSVPHKEGYEISLFQDPEKLPLDVLLKGFTYIIKDSKIYVNFKQA